VGGGQKVGVIVIVDTGCMISVKVGEGMGLGESGSSGTGCAASVNVDEGMGLDESGSAGTGCAVSVKVDEGMGLGEAGMSVTAGTQPTNIADTSNGIKIVTRFIRYPLKREKTPLVPKPTYVLSMLYMSASNSLGCITDSGAGRKSFTLRVTR